jgi:hypothetical protein
LKLVQQGAKSRKREVDVGQGEVDKTVYGGFGNYIVLDSSEGETRVTWQLEMSVNMGLVVPVRDKGGRTFCSSFCWRR